MKINVLYSLFFPDWVYVCQSLCKMSVSMCMYVCVFMILYLCVCDTVVSFLPSPRCLLDKDFVRIGKWFVKPYELEEKPLATR